MSPFARGEGEGGVALSQVEGRPSASNTVEPVFDDVLGGGFACLGIEEGGENGRRVVIGMLFASRGKHGTGNKGASGNKAYGLLYSGFLLVSEGGRGNEGGDTGEEEEGGGAFCAFWLPPATSLTVFAFFIAVVNRGAL